ncbi:hypothetical protein BKN49_05920 [Pseudomonas aeruginosa]|nr:hypothetical protein BKN49_05920 [Pseudomonas aeruginosa]
MSIHLTKNTPEIIFKDTCGILVSEIEWIGMLAGVMERELNLAPGSISTLSQLGSAYSHLQTTAQICAYAMARLERVADKAILLAFDAQKHRTDLAGLAMRGLLRKHLAGSVVTSVEHEQVARLQRMYKTGHQGGQAHSH